MRVCTRGVVCVRSVCALCLYVVCVRGVCSVCVRSCVRGVFLRSVCVRIVCVRSVCA